ncbi:amino acid adenylation domain-containing protein [Streptomyces griseoviridis]|uniref:Amino acid adenylation domain-containing protein n=1 Tax=Streptomyces griseoviridis TaxID=45398 RepID=A0A3S9ZNX7_STRGD|nr:non-ribosomal peptide synthetase [Streptomyces griseoviridis]AZS89595.1 amino acid adenylation domain-containing protein [Streptomyces griseoviridis]QCN83567.1 hypothetical protein DDJ31_00105 [Streptomyces griseoviridis]
MNDVLFAHELLEAQAARIPAAVAVRDGDRVLTYAELDTRANRLARYLRTLGVGSGSLVAVALPRSADLVVALSSVLKAGAAYLPLDPDYPPAHVSAVLEDARPVLLITAYPSVPQLSAPQLRLEEPGTEQALVALPGGTLTDDERGRAVRPLDTAYVIHTSGSTGRPKGVMVTHQGLASYLAWCRDAYPGLAEGALLHSAVAFDLTVTALFGPLSVGGAVVVRDLVARDDDMSCEPLNGIASGIRVGFLKVTPSHLALLDAVPEPLLPTTDLVVGGEQLLGEQLEEWRRRVPGVVITNEYGPTEATVGCVTYRLEPGDSVPQGPVPIGRPAPGVQAHVLDEQFRPVADGAVGELFVAGDQVALGYLNQPELTAERFIADPFASSNARMYRTGDLVRRLPDGDLAYVGRVDQQVKIRSHRVEPGELEAVLAAMDGVGQVCVTAEPGPGGLCLVAHVVPQGEADGLARRLRHQAAEQLPAYMLPSAVVLVDRMPLTPQGKVDRAALTAAFPATQVLRAPLSEPGTGGAATDAEELLARLCAELLGVDRVDPADNFFTLGGNSLLGIQLAARARRSGLALTPTDVFRCGTVRAMAARSADTTPSVQGAGQC